MRFPVLIILVMSFSLYAQTGKATGERYKSDFKRGAGSEWSNTKSDSTPVGGRKFLGQFGNESVTLSLTKRKAGMITLEFDLFLINSWDGNYTGYGPDYFMVSVGKEKELIKTTFSNLDENNWKQSYPAMAGLGNNPAYTGAKERDSLGYKYFGDSVYRLRFTFRHKIGPVEIKFSAKGLQNLADESWGIANVVVDGASKQERSQDECDEESSVCSLNCRSKFWRWSFWVTNYNVAGSFGKGQHQGIGVFGYEYVFDPRFPTSSGKKPIWEKASSSGFGKKISYPDHSAVKSAAICSQRQIFSRYIHNHGRTVAAVKVARKRRLEGDILRTNLNDIPIKRLSTFTVGPLDYKQWNDSKNSNVKRQTAATPCVRQIKDGYCDSVCGNCSYVLPAGLGVGNRDRNNEIKYQRTQFTILERWANITSQTRYYQGKLDSGSPIWGKNILGTPVEYDDPFTHCFSPTSNVTQQALMSKFGWLGRNTRVITGLYGHNSNTDAEAGFQQFHACATDPIAELNRASNVSPEACKVCGIPEIQNNKPIQFPCIMNRNTARAKWERTKELHNIDNEDVGKIPKRKWPVCRTNGQPVRGM